MIICNYIYICWYCESKPWTIHTLQNCTHAGWLGLKKRLILNIKSPTGDDTKSPPGLFFVMWKNQDTSSKPWKISSNHYFCWWHPQLDPRKSSWKSHNCCWKTWLNFSIFLRLNHHELFEKPWKSPCCLRHNFWWLKITIKSPWNQHEISCFSWEVDGHASLLFALGGSQGTHGDRMTLESMGFSLGVLL